MRGLKKTQMAGTVSTSAPAASAKGSNRPMETSPGSPPKPEPAPGPDATFSPKRIEPVTPTEKEFQLLPEKGKDKFFNVTSCSLSSEPKSASQRNGTFSTR